MIESNVVICRFELHIDELIDKLRQKLGHISMLYFLLTCEIEETIDYFYHLILEIVRDCHMVQIGDLP